jgi:hypothetical protein
MAEDAGVSDVTRYQPRHHDDDFMAIDPEGEYVDWDDYARIRGKFAEVESLLREILVHGEWYGEDFEICGLPPELIVAMRYYRGDTDEVHGRQPRDP